MNSKSIGEKIQSLAPIVLIISLVSSTVVFVVNMGYIYNAFGSSLQLGNLVSTTNITSFIVNFITGILKAVVIYFCLKGFGHLLINSDKSISIMESKDAPSLAEQSGKEADE